MVDVSKWIVNAWSMVSASVVAKSFKATRISNHLDSTEDGVVRDSEQEPNQFCRQ